MQKSMSPMPDINNPMCDRITCLSAMMLRYSLVVIFLWFGGMKFTAYEAGIIAPLVMNSPLVGWWHALFGIPGTAMMLGVFEIATGLLLAINTWSPRASIIGGIMAIITYLVTLSFFLTTPGVAEPLAGGFPAISGNPGQFLLKDAVLLAASFWCLGDSMRAFRRMM